MSVSTDIKLIDNASKVLVGVNSKVQALDKEIDKVNDKDIISKESILESMKGIEQLQDKLNDIGDTIQGLGQNGGLGSSLGSLGSTLGSALGGAIGGAIGSAVGNAIDGVIEKVKESISDVIKWSDNLTMQASRLELVDVTGFEDTKDLLREIKDLSLETKASFSETTNTVANLRTNLKDVFTDDRELLQFVENINKSFKIAGTSAVEAEGVIRQLSQALGSGVLRGDEFNTVFENAPTLMHNIADYMGVPLGKVRELAFEGKLTTDTVKKAILNATDEIDAKFGGLNTTFEDVKTNFETIASYSFINLQDEINDIAVALENMLPIAEVGLESLSLVAESVINGLRDIATGINEYVKPAFDFLIAPIKRIGEASKKLAEDTLEAHLTTAEAIKISVGATVEMGITLVKKAGNAIFNIADIVIGGLGIMLSTFIEYALKGVAFLAKQLEKVAGWFGAEWDLSSGIEDTAKDFEEMKETLHKRLVTEDNYFNDKYFGTNNLKGLWTEIMQDVGTKVLDKKILDTNNNNNNNNSNNNNNNTIENIDNITNSLSRLGDTAGRTSQAIEPTSRVLNDFNKTITEYNEAIYHNNVANQFTGNIEIVAYGTDEEGQKAIGKQTEEAIRRVFNNAIADRTAVSTYA